MSEVTPKYRIEHDDGMWTVQRLQNNGLWSEISTSVLYTDAELILASILKSNQLQSRLTAAEENVRWMREALELLRSYPNDFRAQSKADEALAKVKGE